MSLWYKSPFNNRYPTVTKDTQARTRTGTITLERFAVVQPIRKSYLPRGCWLLDIEWDEEVSVACYCDRNRFILVPVVNIDFSK